MMTHRLNRILSILLFSTVAGCSQTQTDDDVSSGAAMPVSSSKVKTNALKGSFGLVSENGKDTIAPRANFTDLEGNQVILEGDDVVFCDGVRLGAAWGPPGNDDLVVPRKPLGQTYRFELRRATESVVADVAETAQVEVLEPARDVVIQRWAPLTVRWAPLADTTVRIGLEATCAYSWLERTTETGTVSLQPFTKMGIQEGPTNIPAPCDGAVEISRERKQVLVTALALTEAVSAQIHRVPVRIVE
jgi:hypothetical protein